jgi:hypothetical protein
MMISIFFYAAAVIIGAVSLGVSLSTGDPSAMVGWGLVAMVMLMIGAALSSVQNRRRGRRIVK